MTNFGTPAAFFKGLKEDQQSIEESSIYKQGQKMTMLPCLRLMMKKYGMNIEISRSNTGATALMSLELVKYNKNGYRVKTEYDTVISDSKIEKGLFELEHKIMSNAKMKPADGFDVLLALLRRGKLNLPMHNDLCSEIIMKKNIVRIGYMGTSPVIGEDLYGGFLMLNGKIVVASEPQVRMRHVLDGLEDAIAAGRRDACRKHIEEFLINYQKNPDNYDNIV